jgi:sodium transport system ATP-binding protein
MKGLSRQFAIGGHRGILPMIEAIKIRKSFGRVCALRELSFVAPDACITGLLGPNGAGKTTGLRCLSTILSPDSGHARIDGIDSVEDSKAVRARLGVLPESRGLYPRLTARENVRYFGRLQGMSGNGLEEEIERLALLLDMGALLDRRTEGFSTGERLRVAVARALVHGPGSLILDEPTAGLDVAGTRSFRNLLRRLRDEGVCVLFSSHLMQEIAALCEEIVILARGEVAAAGKPLEIQALVGAETLEDAFVAIVGESEGLT